MRRVSPHSPSPPHHIGAPQPSIGPCAHNTSIQSFALTQLGPAGTVVPLPSAHTSYMHTLNIHCAQISAPSTPVLSHRLRPAVRRTAPYLAPANLSILARGLISRKTPPRTHTLLRSDALTCKAALARTPATSPAQSLVLLRASQQLSMKGFIRGQHGQQESEVRR